MALTFKKTLVIGACLALYSNAAWAEGTLEVMEQNGLSYVTGGIGNEQSDAMIATAHEYNLRIMNADKTGHFSGDTRVVISDMEGNVLIEDTSESLFYANLPKGRYIVKGFSGEQSKTQTVAITNNRPVKIRFMWAEDRDYYPNH